jgi:hypothetical protein
LLGHSDPEVFGSPGSGTQVLLTRAVFGPAEALLLSRPDALELIVEGELRARLHVTQGEQSHPRVTVHRPLLGDAVRVTAVVHEPETTHAV